MIALLKPDLAWQELLKQAGLSFQVHSPDSSTRVLIIPVDSCSSEIKSALSSVLPGTGILAEGPAAAQLLPGSRFRQRYIKALIPEQTRLFRNIGPVFAHCQGWQINNNDSTVVLCRSSEAGGYPLAVLPFRLSDAVRVGETTTRAFEWSSPRPVVERVALRTRGEVRRLITTLVCWLLEQQSLPIAFLAYCPGNSRSLFGFRLDTDYCGREEMLAALRMSGQVAMPFSWFVNTQAHEILLDETSVPLNGQDVQVHCYRHKVYRKLAANRENLLRAKSVLVNHGYKPTGAASPYGDWNPAWNQALIETGFDYSSDFAAGYDDLPFRPLVANRLSNVLQVPTHPICTGSFNRTGIPEDAIESYFRMIIRRSYDLGEPCLLYDHPDGILRNYHLLYRVIAFAKELCEKQMTLTELSNWWRFREQVSYKVFARVNEIQLDVETGFGDVMVELQMNEKWCRLPLKSGCYRLAELLWRPLNDECRTQQLDNYLKLPLRKIPVRNSVSEKLRWLRRQTRTSRR